jgi:hypothetical protein
VLWRRWEHFESTYGQEAFLVYAMLYVTIARHPKPTISYQDIQSGHLLNLTSIASQADDDE